MAEPFLPLTALTEVQRTQALERFTIIRPALEEGISRAQVAPTSQIAPSTVQLWIKRYREKGLAGLANNVARSDKGKSRKLPETAIQLVEGLALQKPPRSRLPFIVRSPLSPKNKGGNLPVMIAFATSSKVLIRPW